MQHHRAVGPVDELAAAVTTLRYAKLSDPNSVSHEAERAATAVVERCRAQVPSGKRWSDRIDPRTITMN
jgi:cysteine sulfinate desulfinase/cysteine desulfurase-like protein